MLKSRYNSPPVGSTHRYRTGTTTSSGSPPIRNDHSRNRGRRVLGLPDKLLIIYSVAPPAGRFFKPVGLRERLPRKEPSCPS